MAEERWTSGEPEPVKLALAACGTHLWAAVEAAQFGRVVHADPAARRAAQSHIDRFVGQFVEHVETWPGLSSPYRMAALQSLDAEIDALNRAGAYLYAASVERLLAIPGRAPLALPVAILHFDRRNGPDATLALPRLAALDDSD